MLLTLTVTVDEPVALPTWVTALMVAVVLEVTCGAVNPPAALMTPILLLQLTALVAEPLAKAVHWLLCRDWMAAGVHDTVMVVTGPTVTVALPFFVGSWTEVAVMVTVALPFTDWAVKTPLPSIVPALEPQETAVLRVPLPVTVAVHWLVCPDCNVVGLQVTLTPVMEELLLEPPPQAGIPKIAANVRISARKRKPAPREPQEPSVMIVSDYLNGK